MKTVIQPSTLDHGPKRYNWVNIIQNGWARVVAHRRCVLCSGRAQEIAICDGCYADLPWREQPWRQRLAGVDAIEVCFDFQYPIRQLLHRAKYGRDIALARLLGQLLAGSLGYASLELARPAALFPVPMARKRLLARGYNQAIEIAEPVSSGCAIPLDIVSVYKRRGLRPQSKLDAATRRSNVRNAFMCRNPPRVASAIIIDDVVTTGATVQAMARALRAAGVQNVHVWALAAA